MSGSPPIERHPLRSGIPCVKHECVQCCIKTSMPILRVDIDRIRRLGYKPKDFVVETGEGWQLKNRYGKCVFLSKSGCSIYPYRPEGCQLYPLIYDEDIHKAVLDNLCPFRYEYEAADNDIQALCQLLKSLRSRKQGDRRLQRHVFHFLQGGLRSRYVF